ncbi:MAG: hypothetical protein HC922_08045 [Leptolyngbyaceae cyanobacterium SM2_3_12]|nr:hypothetical protein [Leptolyngbyaceae cyanobacterium SM2_3_12]
MAYGYKQISFPCPIAMALKSMLEDDSNHQNAKKRIINILIALSVVSVPALIVVLGHAVDLLTESSPEGEKAVQVAADSTPINVNRHLELGIKLRVREIIKQHY